MLIQVARDCVRTLREIVPSSTIRSRWIRGRRVDCEDGRETMSDAAVESHDCDREMINVLTPIWERVLKHSAIHPDENFFDLGGDSLLALALFLEIEKQTGRKLPITIIYDAPTIASLAKVLQKSDTLPKISPLVLLKPGVDAPPLFMMHGLGATVIGLFELGKRMPSSHPIYGVQPRGSDGVEAPDERLEDMAHY